MPWQSVLKSFIVGTDRSPLPERDLEALGLSIAHDPAQAALESLAAVNLLRKAGFTLPESPVSSFPISDEDTRAICSDAAVKDLNLMLSGRFADALPEFLDLLALKRLPPESLPDLLEKADRDASFAEKVRPVLGPRGKWLAQLNPRWHTVIGGEETDWFTAAFPERKKLLVITRARNPLLALALLEKTWREEKTDHKVQFLDILRIRLSPLDEDLLEKALADKSREVRRTALEMLTMLPESRIALETNNFFKLRLSGVFEQKSKKEADTFLQKTLPDLSEEALQPWLAFLSKSALSDWRRELVCLFIRLSPPAGLPAPAETLPPLFDETLYASAFLEAIVRHEDGSRVEMVLRHFSRDFRHAIWQSKEMSAFLTHFAPEALAFLHKKKIVLDYDNQAVLRAIEHYDLPWPKPLLENVLEQYRRPLYGDGDIPGWHYTSALNMAAYHCHPPDATNCALVRDYLQYSPKARPREFESFLEIIRFRLKLQQHLQ